MGGPSYLWLRGDVREMTSWPRGGHSAANLHLVIMSASQRMFFPAFSKTQLLAFLFAALTNAVLSPIKLPEGCCFKAWLEVSDSQQANAHFYGEGQAREGACASPLIRRRTCKTVSPTLCQTICFTQLKKWLWWLFNVAFTFLRRGCALLGCAAVAEHCVPKGSRRRPGMLQEADNPWTRHRSHLAPAAFGSTFKGIVRASKERAEWVSTPDSLRRMPGPQLPLDKCSSSELTAQRKIRIYRSQQLSGSNTTSNRSGGVYGRLRTAQAM